MNALCKEGRNKKNNKKEEEGKKKGPYYQASVLFLAASPL
jgi:hypothetical protein